MVTHILQIVCVFCVQPKHFKVKAFVQIDTDEGTYISSGI